MSRIFISYSRQDSECVLKTARQLEANGYQVWIDVDSIPGGDEWGVKIAEGVSDAIVTLVFWSSNAAKSDYVKQEYESAIQKKMQNPQANRSIIPVMLETFGKAQLPELLSGYQAVKMYNCSKNEIDALIREIAEEHDLKYRRFFPFDLTKSAKELHGARPLSLLPNLVSTPFMQSVH